MLASATGMKAANIYVVERIVPVFYPAETKSVPVQSILSIVLAVIIGGLLLFVVFRSMKPHEVVETEPELSVEALLATTKENQTLDDIELVINPLPSSRLRNLWMKTRKQWWHCYEIG